MTMRRVLLRVLVIVVLLTLLGLALAATFLVHGPDEGVSSIIYTPAQLDTALSADPRSWSGRTVRVRGILTSGYESGGGVAAHWVDELGPTIPGPGPITEEDLLEIAPRPSNQWLDPLYRIPYLRDILPRKQRPLIGRVAVYLLKLQDPTTCNPTTTRPVCIEGVVLNAQGWDQ